jgi:RNA polymerase sigma-70 factor (ECF subfamily)
MDESLSDAQVIEQVVSGDTEAFGLLVDRYQGECEAYAKYITGSPDEAADIVQDSLVRAYQSLRRCRDPKRFKGWLFRIVSNQCKTHLARRRRRRHLSLSTAAEHPADHATDAEAEVAEVRRRLHEALQALPLDQREALVLKHVHGMSLPEMAELLSATVPALKMRLLRGRQALRERLRGVGL